MVVKAIGATPPPQRLDPQFQQWFTSNPLLRWRIAHVREAREVEDVLRLPRGSVRRWETGEAAPGDAELARLARLTGITDLASQWTHWASARPDPSRTAP
jgi:transcriptional regulator with XRE-family HTH domain